MNRFILDYNPLISAKYHCDKHVVKMIVEEAQMLSTVHRLYGDGDGLYKATHKHHPCTVWAGQTIDNYLYGWTLLVALCNEYTHRYGKIHATARLIEPLAAIPHGINKGGLTEFPQAMPDEYRRDNAVEAYRAFYRGAKAVFCRWTNRPQPDWW